MIKDQHHEFLHSSVDVDVLSVMLVAEIATIASMDIKYLR